MPLDFISGEPEGTSQEALVYVQDDTVTDGDYSEGEVAASVPMLVAVDGPEDVVAYVNEPSSDSDAEDKLASVSVDGNEVVLDLGIDDASSIDGAIDEQGGLFVSPDEFDEDGNYEYDDDENTVAEADGIPVVLQASGY